jgi:DNA-binding MarR family transcriptional regulator
MTDSEMENLVEDVSLVMHVLIRKAYGKTDEYLKPYGLVRSHVFILHTLMNGEEITMSELSDKLQVTKQNVTVLTDKLEKLGLVCRVASKKDRRVFFIRLSEKGTEFVGEHAEKIINAFAESFNKFNADDLRLFKDTIATLKNLLSKL